ncbi:Uncharacterized conserved protein, DUF302 family [Aliiroseovarius crassostreae]|uniref:DUF302 domain-containing protein n=1 Tax=Aliiroseovarius crassostreae TaxID=154981 RepID=A0A0P7IVZ5_9RHOB|nr:DUF302 domain-containing protein [Aliiroseovarius crassostreae]KPN62860.1 hypothetical protein AKJ29_01625 [Aliiroseovarius crassostreae]SFU72191.1 Uncharacterized conserved protein, DUF302 family [Aliiroseovarius crassostreae]
MSYTYDRLLAGVHIDDADMRIRKSLQEKGFGILTEIDVQETMKAKIDMDMDGYRILGACNPNMAYQALDSEARIGAMLPCNVVLRSLEGGTEISAVDPVASMAAVQNRNLQAVAETVREMLIEAVDQA